MKVDCYLPPGLPTSIKLYADHVISRLEYDFSVDIKIVRAFEDLRPDVDLFWDPTQAGGRPPESWTKNIDAPVVVTLHGAGNFSLSSIEFNGSLLAGIKGFFRNQYIRLQWRAFSGEDILKTHFITVSEYAKDELHKYLKLPDHNITPIYHGYDPEIFKPAPWKKNNTNPYFLHVAAYQPKKNTDRVIRAYQSIAVPKPRLVLIVPGYRGHIHDKNIVLINKPVPHTKLVRYFQYALAFVFPSLHESFGLPLIEAMACACPVISSNDTACKEIVGNAGLLVNPRSEEEIAAAMKRSVNNDFLLNLLTEYGLENVKRFSWDDSALKHYRLFSNLIKNNSSNNRTNKNNNYEKVSFDNHRDAQVWDYHVNTNP